MGVATARSPLNRLRRTCLALPDAWEKVSHGAAGRSRSR